MADKELLRTVSIHLQACTPSYSLRRMADHSSLAMHPDRPAGRSQRREALGDAAKELSDPELVAGLAAGEVELIRVLYQRYGGLA
jgi:hypothetical protein